MGIRARKAEIDRRNKDFMLNTRWLVKFFAPSLERSQEAMSRLKRTFVWTVR